MTKIDPLRTIQILQDHGAISFRGPINLELTQVTSASTCVA